MFRSTIFKAGIAAALAVVAVGAAVWYFYLRNDSPPPVSLANAIESLDASTPATSLVAATTTSTTSATSETTTGDAAAPVGVTSNDGLAGTWTVVIGDSSFVGYRVDETLAGVGATTAVGRTGDIEGMLEFDGSTITAVEVKADLTTLTSDKSMRDGQLGNQAIETNTYPAATFVLASPIAISDVPEDGVSVTQTVTGELTLHGVTNTVEIEVEGALQDGLLVVVGSTEIQFADYDIDQPVSMSVVSIEDHGTMEFQLVFDLA